MSYLLATASVEDFGAWKSSFERFDSFRAEHGQLGYQVFQSAKDPDEVVILFEWDEEKDPQAFFKSEEMRERMVKAGVQGRPEMSLLKFVTQKSAPKHSA